MSLLIVTARQIWAGIEKNSQRVGPYKKKVQNHALALVNFQVLRLKALGFRSLRNPRLDDDLLSFHGSVKVEAAMLALREAILVKSILGRR